MHEDYSPGEPVDPPSDPPQKNPHAEFVAELAEGSRTLFELLTATGGSGLPVSPDVAMHVVRYFGCTVIDKRYDRA